MNLRQKKNIYVSQKDVRINVKWQTREGEIYFSTTTAKEA